MNIDSNSVKKGRALVLDGKDGSGKATQTRLYVEHLRKIGRRVETIDFPRYQDNLGGKLIRECLDGKHGDFISLDPKIASVLYAVDRFETLALINKWLNDGVIVVFDRYVSANQIHQGGKISDEAKRKEFLQWLDDLEFGVFKLPRPDKVIYLDVPVEVSMRLASDRAKAKGESSDSAESNVKHQMESQESALSIIKSSNNWVRLDCSDGKGNLLPIEVVHGMVVKAFEDML